MVSVLNRVPIGNCSKVVVNYSVSWRSEEPTKHIKVASHALTPKVNPVLNGNFISKNFKFLGNQSAICGTRIPTQVRFKHRLTVPREMEEIRLDSTKDRYMNHRDTEFDRKFYHYSAMLVTSSLGIMAVKTVFTGFIDGLSPCRMNLAMSKIEVDVSGIPEGKTMTFKWQDKPIFVRQRTNDEIELENGTSLGELRDPQSTEARSSNGNWVVLLGICTHLGCVPIADKGNFLGGYYCPCHGSHYDSLGRIRKGPAPLNLEIPKHNFKGDTLVIG